MPVGRDETGLGRAQDRYPRDALADGFECKFIKRVADMLSDTCSGILQDANAAARYLGRSLQSVSRSLVALEQEVGVELVRRTTRRLNPTDAGLAFYRRLSAALSEIDAAKL